MNDVKALAGRVLPLIDLTNLNDDCAAADIDALCARASTPFGPVAAVCVWPRFVAQGSSALAGTGIRVATVVNFPQGGTNQRAVVSETRQAIADEADEIDLVMPHGALKSGDEATARAMISTVRAATQGLARLKVIVESGELGSAELIERASVMALQEGADFIKTSTGKVAENATPATARIMLKAIAKYGDRSRGFKPAGGIRSLADAGAYLKIADEIMGPGWATPTTFRFGASGLLDSVISALQGKGEASRGGGY